MTNPAPQTRKLVSTSAAQRTGLFLSMTGRACFEISREVVSHHAPHIHWLRLQLRKHSPPLNHIIQSSWEDFSAVTGQERTPHSDLARAQP